jgi:chemotaxis protein MotB
MPRRRPTAEPVNHERWLVSYADFITLLFAFFVMLYAHSNVNRQKAQAISQSFKEAINEGDFRSAFSHASSTPARLRTPRPVEPQAEAPVDLDALELKPSLERLNLQLAREIDAGRLEVRLERRGLVVSLREASFFQLADDIVQPAAYPALEKIAAAIAPLPNPIRLEGHTDSLPIHSARFRSNWELSAARGIAMLELFAGRFAIPRERMAIAGFADTAPVAINDTPEGRARNRRVDIIVLNATGLKSEPPQSAPPSPDHR